jgi:pimeloyl-ACP methyl ester carboxylesterase
MGGNDRETQSSRLLPGETIAACADVAFAKPGRLPADALSASGADGRDDAWDEFSDHVTTQAVGARFMESPRARTSSSSSATSSGLNDPYTVRQACLAMENMDLSPLVPQIARPLLMTNGTHDVLCPPDLAPSGLGARKMAEQNEHIELVEFPDIGHADLVECPQDAIRIVGEFFERALAAVAAYFSGFVPAIQMITRLNFPSASMSKKLQLCMSFFVPSTSSPM